MNVVDLLNAALLSLPASDQLLHQSRISAGGAEPHIEFAAHYSMTQNQRAIALYLIGDVVLKFGEKFTHLIKVMSSTVSGPPESRWLAKGGQRLKVEAANLMAEGVELLVKDVRDELPATGRQETVRYQYGENRFSERASIISTDCGRLTMRNLRNWILSAPVDDPSCSG